MSPRAAWSNCSCLISGGEVEFARDDGLCAHSLREPCESTNEGAGVDTMARPSVDVWVLAPS